MDRLDNIHPGEILKLDFLDELEITSYRLAKDIGVPQTRISQIIHGKRPITLDTAVRLSRYFNTSAQFWLNLQSHYDLEELRLGHSKEYEHIRPYQESVAA